MMATDSKISSKENEIRNNCALMHASTYEQAQVNKFKNHPMILFV
jgi:hypothetical protein